MSSLSPPTTSFRLRADAIRDVCSRPAVLQEIGNAVPLAAVESNAERRQAVSDGVARALALALELEDSGAQPEREQVMLLEADQRMWAPVDVALARLLQRAGPDGLFAFYVVEGATRREAWRADAQRRRGRCHAALSTDAVWRDDFDPVDLASFRLDVERTAALTAQRIGVSQELVLELLAEDISYAEAGRQTGRSSNGLWMALARLRPTWRGVAERGRAAGLGGGALIDLADRTDTAVRRVVRWRLVGGLTAALLLAATGGALLTASLLERGGLPPRAVAAEPTIDSVGPSEDSPFSQLGRLAALEAARRLASATLAPVITKPAPAAVRAARTAGAGTSAPKAFVPAASKSPSPPRELASSCGLGTASLSCR